MRKRSDSIPASEPPEFARLYRSGASMLTIARRFGRSPNTVRLHLLDNGVETRPRGRRPA
jgi:transposase-like protein